MTRTLLAGAAALLLTGAAGAAHGNELTQPRDGGSADISFDTTLPGGAGSGFTPSAAAEDSGEPVSEQTRQSLVELAIEAGQTSSKSAEEPNKQTPPAGVQEHAERILGGNAAQ